eukprot:scaffold8354_cov68-Cyclotella_meneghiniana.AAC.3
MREQSNPKFLEHACIATRMIDKRRQLFDLQETFHVEKKNHDAKLAILKQKEDEYERQDMEFQKKLIHFENNNKESAYTRATQRLAEETKLCVAIDNDIAIILKLLEEKKAEEKRLAELLKRCTTGSDVLDEYELPMNEPCRETRMTESV